MDDEPTRTDSDRAGRELEAETLIVLGRLAGGIAHDFNNQLTSIIGYADLLLFDLPADAGGNATVRQDLSEIRQAAERAHLITKQLLAFSQPRPAEPAIVNVASVVMAHLHLLRRILGDDVQLATSVARDTVERDPGLVRADPSHLGHVVIGLAARARHALPHGGTLTIEVANAADGAAVHLSLRAAHARQDDAPPAPSWAPSPASSAPSAPSSARPSAPPSTIPSALGAPPPPTPPATPPAPSRLAAIEDLVRQAGGRLVFEGDAWGSLHVTVQLPRVTLDRGSSQADGDAIERASPRGIERVLVVDDDDGVRGLVGTILERHGYQVAMAARPSQALVLASAQAVRLDLAIIDLVLPEQRGETLAAALIARCPGLRVLYITGFGDQQAAAAPGTPAAFLLQKPFSAVELLVAVRQAIDSIPAA